jgi:hypothetical protein
VPSIVVANNEAMVSASRVLQIKTLNELPHQHTVCQCCPKYNPKKPGRNKSEGA